MLFLKGILLLLLTLLGFSAFSLKAPKGEQAMSGLANAAVATFLIEAICKYIGGDFAGIVFLGEVGGASGTMGGVAAAILVGMAMGMNPVFAVAAGAAVAGFGILPGFIVGYVLYFILKLVTQKMPAGVSTIVGALLAAVLARGIAFVVNPAVNFLIGSIGDAIMVATGQAPLLMGFVLGGIMKMVCTSPLSSMALTAMLQLTSLPMGIAAIACVGGSFTNGMLFKRLRLGDNSKVLAVMLEPLTQADIVTRNPVPIYASNFLGGGLAGIAAAALGIVNNAPGTASPIPGLIAPFAFNDWRLVLAALGLAALGGTLAGWLGSMVFAKKSRAHVLQH